VIKKTNETNIHFRPGKTGCETALDMDNCGFIFIPHYEFPRLRSTLMITGSIVALVTPMTETGDIDWAALERLIDWHISNGTQALGLVGTTGEASTLSHPEHREVIRFGVSHAGGRIPIMAGTGSNATLEAVELTVSAAEAGADCALLVTPYYNRPTQEGLYQHFKTVAGAINLPIVLYNVPSRTGCDLSVETTLRLSQIENIVGLKDATGDVARGAALIQAVA
jgi:4-hydroxy-tetrahydrodipicolinate synthase